MTSQTTLTRPASGLEDDARYEAIVRRDPAADDTFFVGVRTTGVYCRPSCASTDWISGRGLDTDSEYNAFYACDANGEPITE